MQEANIGALCPLYQDEPAKVVRAEVQSVPSAAHCACVLGMSNVERTLGLTQYMLEECHFPSRSKAAFSQTSWRKWLAGWGG